MKYYLFNFIFVILAVIIHYKGYYFGVPIWVIISLFFTLLFAISLIIIIDKKWDDLS